jgi:hypothetical protein
MKELNKQKGVTLWFDEDLIDVLNKYRVSMGWTWNRFFLYGVATTISKDSENSELLVEIANYLENRR